MLLWTKQEIIAISLVLFYDLVVLNEKVREVRGGISVLLRSSSVTSANFGLSISISYLHHVFLKSLTFFGFFIVIQHGPLIFLFKIKSSSML